MIDQDYLKKIQRLAAESKDSGVLSEWNELIKELTDYLNDNRGRDPKGDKYPEVQPKRIAMLVSYIKQAGGYGELRYFINEVQRKGPWFFWWTVKPKKEKDGSIKSPKKW